MPQVSAPSSGMLQLGMQQGSEFQKQILQDGEVTRGEYESAFGATVSCMRNQGLQVLGPDWASSETRLGYSVADSAGSAGVQDACEQEYLIWVSAVWDEQQKPTGEEAERIRREYVACLQDHGIVLPDDASVDEANAVAATAPNGAGDECIAQFAY
jgi:hypothetical protein